AIWYIVVQCVGAIAAAGIVTAIASGKADYSIAINGIGQNFYGKDYSLGACFLAEAVLTGIFIFVIFGATSKKAPQGFAGIPIGITILLIHLISIPITGTSVNPARSLGPAVFAGVEALSQIWLFWVAPILGAVIASIIWFVLFEQNEK
ncbi:TPA: aquaporin, partial [bacterium]|nr:aquaporin [bacterium]